MPSHFREYFLFGLFFLIITPLQLAWAEAVRRAPDDRRLLVAGAVGNLAVVGVWLVTRTIGLPFGPNRLQAEAVGLKDLISTYDEAMIAGVVALILWQSAQFRARAWLLATGWALACASVVIAFVPGGH